MPNLKVLYFKGNPVTRLINNYRRTLINSIHNITYLDDRPVNEGDRLGAEAFFKGGYEAERKARDAWIKKNDIVAGIREREKEMMKETFEERRQKALESLQTEYNNRKVTLEEKKRKLIKDIEENPSKKIEISRELQLIDYQINENEKFKQIEEKNVLSSMSKREKHDKFSVFEYEDWMNGIFENHIVENLFDFSVAVKLIQLDLKNRNVKNYDLFSELDLRNKWTEIELKNFRTKEENERLYLYNSELQRKIEDDRIVTKNIDNRSKSTVIEEATLNEDIIEDNKIFKKETHIFNDYNQDQVKIEEFVKTNFNELD